MTDHDTKHYIRKSLHANGRKKISDDIVAEIRREQITDELRDAGLRGHPLRSMESHYLPHIIGKNEHIKGVVYGYQEMGFVMLIATDRKIIFLDRKPLFMNEDEITYDVVSGVVHNHSVIGTTVTLHTRVKDYKIFCFNRESTAIFVDYIESRCLANNGKRERNDIFA